MQLSTISSGGVNQGEPRAHVLVVDDSRSQRRILLASLKRWGYVVTEAASGVEALALCRHTDFDIVLSDWMMPGMSGLDLCRAFRDLPRQSYGYFILLTSKSGKDEVARGLDVGADDFLSKPVSPDELRARMQAGERLLGMQRELTEKNRLLGATLDELQGLYDSLDRDLIEARKLQQSLVRDRQHDFGSACISLLLRPSGHVGGDLVGYFPLPLGRIAFFAIDVSGHGVASAMMAARLAGMLSGASRDGNVALAISEEHPLHAWPPETVAQRLNDLVLDVMRVDQYFTCIYAEADPVSGHVRMVQAGHPHPYVLRADGSSDRLGAGGLPVGLVAGARYDRLEVTLNPGDRLFLMSDGLSECRDLAGAELGEDGVIAHALKNRGLSGGAFLDALLWDVEAYAGRGDMADDISAVLYEYRGPVG